MRVIQLDSIGPRPQELEDSRSQSSHLVTQRTDQAACFPQRHGPHGRVTLQAGMTGKVAAYLSPIGRGSERTDLVPGYPTALVEPGHVIEQDLVNLVQLSPTGRRVGVAEQVQDLGDVRVGLGQLHVTRTRCWWGRGLLPVHRYCGGVGASARLGRIH
jgi:hypothetical protein